MGISIFPSTAAEFVSNNFVVDMNDTTNNTVTLEDIKQAGTYNISLASGDTTFDVYLLDSDGALVAYTNSGAITAGGLFKIVVILGVATDEEISFSYAGTVSDTTASGQQTAAGAYLTSISPADLPGIDDTANVVGGNFASDVEIDFVSGATVLPAKNIVRTDSTALVVTRPDALIEDDAPYDLRAINPGVTPPTGSNAHILAGTVTAGSDPTWVTTSPLNDCIPTVAFSQTLEATDSDGTIADYSVTAGTITPGLTLASNGVLSGTPTTAGTFTFTVTATDDGGNETPKEFTQTANVQVTGGTQTTSGGFVYHTFTTTDNLVVTGGSKTVDVLAVAGGGGGGNANSGGGGGAGGMVTLSSQTLTEGTHLAQVGAGGNGGGSGGNSGGNSQLGNTTEAIGGGGGPSFSNAATAPSGGSGAGGHSPNTSAQPGGSGTSGQGSSGGSGFNNNSNSQSTGGGGGGASNSGNNGSNSAGGNGGNGQTWLDGVTYAGGGGGGYQGNATNQASGGNGGGGIGGAFSNDFNPTSGTDGLGGGAGSGQGATTSGGNGIVIVRYAE